MRGVCPGSQSKYYTLFTITGRERLYPIVRYFPKNKEAQSGKNPYGQPGHRTARPGGGL